MKKTLVTCSGPTEFRMVNALYKLIESNIQVCKPFLPVPMETCKLEEAKECYKELKETISKVTDGDYSKICV
jgi:hypothetical protein